jgi:hypothetical protein
MIIDSQIHAYDTNTPKRPCRTVPSWPPSATDASYAVEVQRKHPGRFGIVNRVLREAVRHEVLSSDGDPHSGPHQWFVVRQDRRSQRGGGCDGEIIGQT